MTKKLFNSELITFILIFAIIILVFSGALKIFFVQDDYILISEFSKNSIAVDFLKSVGPAEVTHWRPMHNLYFLIAGNIFAKNYTAYHFVNILILSLSGLFVYKIVFLFIKSKIYSFFATIFFAINPSHFVSLYWISGGANLIGFLFFSISFYLFLKKHTLLYPIFFLFSLLASEAFIATIAFFVLYELIADRKVTLKNYISLFILFLIYLPLKFLLTSKDIVAAYSLILNFSIVNSLKYYVLRIVGLPETSRNSILTAVVLMAFFTLGTFSFLKSKKAQIRYLVFAAFVVVIGLIPFLLLKDHLSPHYMALPIFGLSIILGFSFFNSGKKASIAFLLTYLVLSSLFVRSTELNNWVVKRSNISKSYIQKIGIEKPSRYSRIVFVDNNLSTSSEAYYALGTGEALNFFFPEEHYSYCFAAFYRCQ